LIGTTIGNYQIRELIGEGGMGKVYLALHPGIGRRAAVKVLHPNLALDEQVVSRFFTEARATNAIAHPSIVDIYDYGTLPEGTPYIVMEYLEGRTLKDELADRQPLIVVALDWACQVAEALAAAHAKQVVHRDLKPENLYVIDDPRVPAHKQIKILDFGIAKLQQGPLGAEQSHRTRTGVLMGTPIYMSPEQCLGVKEVDARSDIYSLGVIIYEMLTGAPPFVSQGVGAIINMHINEAPVPPSQHNPNVSPELEAAVMRALAKTPDDRYGGMYELLGDLQDALEALSGSPSAPVPRPSMRTPISSVPTTKVARTPPPTTPPQPTPGSTLAQGVAIERAPSSSTVTVSRRRLGALVAVGVGMAVALGIFGLRRHPPAPPPAPAVATPEPAHKPPPPTPEPPRPPSTVEIALDSAPAGATVRLGDVVVGTTPTVLRTKPGEEPIELAFTLEGYRREIIKALPAAGLRLKAQLERLPAPAPRPAPKPARPHKAPVDDIKSER
jgi:serine/threonine-protein kinase